MAGAGCPRNAVRYNGTLCFCPPGQLVDPTSNACALFSAASGIKTDEGVDTYTTSFPETILSFDQIEKFTQSQAVFLEATLVLLLSWLSFCIFLRFMKLGDGKSVWFRLRWWISRLDVTFATRHWLEDQKVVRKRKTELGGTFSIASWILFIGLFAALLYQVISRRSVEVHNVRATNGPDLALFINDMEFNITTVSSMSCSNLRDLGTVVTGNPGFIDQRVAPLSNFVNYSCLNTSKGPTITMKCKDCQLIHDHIYISWKFVDIPNIPATAVGFEFNVTTKNQANKRHVSFVSGLVKNGSTLDDRPVTFRGVDPNILKFNLFPRIYQNFHDLRLIQPLFHDFLPGSSLRETNQLQTSLQNPNDGVINTTLFVNFLSDYIIEIENQNIMGPVSFLADLGGLYCISIGIFFYCLVQCEYRVKKLRNEDKMMRQIRNRRKAQERWGKLRRYVMYTWGCSTLDDKYNTFKKDPGCNPFAVQLVRGNGSVRGSGSSHKRSQQTRLDSISFNEKVGLPDEKNTIPRNTHTLEMKSCIAGTAPNCEGRTSISKDELPSKSEATSSANGGKQRDSRGLCATDASQSNTYSLTHDTIPLPPSLDFKDGSQIDMSDIQKNLQSLYDYNVMLREKFIAAQSLLHDLATKSSSLATHS